LVRGSIGNIPIDLLKTLVLIADLGSVTRAATALGISQSAVSAQIRRLESRVAGVVFVKQGRGVQLSELGQLISSHARRIVALSDQLQTIVGAGPRKTQVRIGLPNGIDPVVIVRAFEALSSQLGEHALVNCDTPANLLRALDSGFIDAAYVVDISPIAATVAAEWIERWHWIKAPDFLLSPGTPVPIVGWPGSLSDRLCITALRRAGVEYSVTFTSANSSLRTAAVRAGLGLTVLSERSIDASNLCIAREYYLPPLPNLRGGIYLADGFDKERAASVLRALQSVLQPAEAASDDGKRQPLPNVRLPNR
jgi:DNA-binding transcriptional LysR family regulator